MNIAAEAELPAEPRILALSPFLREVIIRVMTWVEDVALDAPQRRLLDVFYDELHSAPKTRLHLPVPADPALKRLSLLLGETTGAATDLSELAHEVGISERSLFRKFHQETGLSPGEWRRQARVLRSFELADQRLVCNRNRCRDWIRKRCRLHPGVPGYRRPNTIAICARCCRDSIEALNGFQNFVS